MEFTRQQIEESARKLIGTPWVHQGRNIEAGIDCLGVIIAVADDIGYLKNFDYGVYPREPDGISIMREMRKYFDEIPKDDVKEGDIAVIRMAGERVPRHLAILVRGKYELSMVHATHDLSTSSTREEAYGRWKPYTTAGFQFRGILD